MEKLCGDGSEKIFDGVCILELLAERSYAVNDGCQPEGEVID